jgi:Holliday junction resolvase
MKPRDNLSGQPKQRGGRRSREKGNRAERAIVAFLQDSGFAAERVPLSGSAGGKYAGDVTIPLLGRDMCAEVKVCAHGFGQLYAWLDGREILIVRQDRREPLVILPLRLAAEIASYAERNSRGKSHNSRCLGFTQDSRRLVVN